MQNANNGFRNQNLNDILQDIPDEKLPILRDLYKQNWPFYIPVYKFIDCIIKWKEKNPETDVKFTCPHGKWQDGTFVVIITESAYHVYIFTLEKSCEKLIQSLRETKRIHWNKGPYVCAVHETVDKFVSRVLPTLGEIAFEIEKRCWWLPKESALNFKIECPSDVYMAPLKLEHALFMNSVWPHAFPGSEQYIATLIAMNGGLGMFTKSENTLCSWITINEFGALAILQTLKEYKRNGYAAVLVKALAKILAWEGKDSIAYIVKNNYASQTLFKSLGFQLISNHKFVRFENIKKRNKIKCHL